MPSPPKQKSATHEVQKFNMDFTQDELLLLKEAMDHKVRYTRPGRLFRASAALRERISAEYKVAQLVNKQES
jgi:hypothetical protein